MLRLALTHGANIDANIKALKIESRDSADSWWFAIPHPGGTVFDIYAHSMLLDDRERAATKIRNRTMYKMLEKAGGEFTKPFKSVESKHVQYWCENIHDEVGELLMVPEMIDCMF